MKKLLFASLLTVAVVFAQADGGSTDTKSKPLKSDPADRFKIKKAANGKFGWKGEKSTKSSTEYTRSQTGTKTQSKAGKQPPAKRPESATASK